jgi:mannan endo-1,4-beta-mannosidase
MNKILILVLLVLLACEVNAQNVQPLEYLKSISGMKTIAGQHNREPNSAPSKWTDTIAARTGKFPGLWSGDFLFQSDNIASRWGMINEAKRQWERGAVVQIMFHTCPPTDGEPCAWSGGVLSTLSEAQWSQLVTDSTTLNNNWKKRLDIISPYLRYLQDSGVVVLFRPLHEMNQSAFWWGGRPGLEGTAKLYRITHEYLTKTKGLTSLVWVWDMQDIDQTWAQYNPGNEYWDILAFDVYGNGYSQSWYNYAVSIAGDKPLAIGECAVLPTSAQLASQPRYVFFMGWAELVFADNAPGAIVSLYNAPNVITLDQMPGWTNGVNVISQNRDSKLPAASALLQNYPNPFNPKTGIRFQVPGVSDVKLAVYDVLGREVTVLVNERKAPGNYEVEFDGRRLASGVYIYRLTAGTFTQVRKMVLLR